MPTQVGSPVSFAGLMAGVRFFGQLPVYLHRKVTLPEARAAQAERLRNRKERFLDRVRRDVFDHPASVYHKLIRYAGCEYSDVEAAVRKNGLEETLAELFRAGVYLTVDEYKGRKTARRGNVEIEVCPERLRSPRAAYHLPGSSGGSRSGGTPVLMDLRFVRDCGGNSSLCLDAWGGKDWRKGDWETPGAGARFRLVKFGAFGSGPEAWFTQIAPDDPSLPRVARWNTRAMRWASTLAGRPLPSPVYAPLSDPTPVIRWLVSVLREGDTPHLFTFPGSAVRLCLEADRKGSDIAGARFTISGEPVTQARVDTIRRSGAIAIPRYGTMETGAIGYGCVNGEHSDDVHLLEDMHAIIPAGRDGESVGLPPTSLLLTTLHARSPFLMINLSMGDEAQFSKRECGCLLGRMGLKTHLHVIRSYEKLTGGGVTFLGTDVIRVLEEILPNQFGGAATDYQLMERESLEGQPILELLVHPSLGELDESRVAEEFYSGLADLEVPGAAAMSQRWRDGKTIQVVRRPPAISCAGKILHLHAGGSAHREG